MKYFPQKFLSLFLSLVMLLGLCVPTAFATEDGYSDTRGHWAEDAIARWSGYGIVEGNNGRFNPNASITRAQMAKILANTLGLTKTAANPFSDVSEKDWFAPYVLRCYAAGIMLGNDGKAQPNITIPRQQAMVMLCRALGIQPEKDPDLSAFNDSTQVGAWAAPYVAALVNSGIVGGTGNGKLSPGGNMSRAALMTVLDRTIVQYIQKPGTYALEDKGGMILVAAGDVTLSGKTAANILVTPAADGKTLTFDKATVTGSVTVQADNAKIATKNSKLPEITMTGEGSKVETVKPASSGGGGGSYTPPPAGPSDLTISEAKTVSGGTYKNVTITSAVGDGEVTLDGVAITGNLTVQGGGSNSIKLKSCAVTGRVILDKTITAESTQQPRLELANTSIAKIEAVKAAIIEAIDALSPITAVEAKANLEIKGASTTIAAITVPVAVADPVSVTVTQGTVAKVEAKSATTVTGASGSISSVVAEAPVSVASEAVATVEVPVTAVDVSVNIEGSAAIEIKADSDTTKIAADDMSNVTVSGEAKNDITTHTHVWGDGEVTRQPSCSETGVKTYTCADQNCPVGTKTESVAKLPHTEVVDAAVEADCLNPGKTAGKHCDVCGETLVAQTEVPALGHAWGKWSKVDDDTHQRVCGNDKNHVETDGHSWDAGVVTIQPTLMNEGEKTHTCSVCSGTKKEEVPATAAGDDLVILNDAVAAGLMTYLDPTALDSNVTRLEIAKLVVAFKSLQVTPIDNTAFEDCVNLTAEEKGVIAAAVNAGLVVGTSQTTFAPGNTVTRAQAVTIIGRLLGNIETTREKTFMDVTESGFYYGAATDMLNLGIISGTAEGKFNPNGLASLRAAIQVLLNAKDWQKHTHAGDWAKVDESTHRQVCDECSLIMGKGDHSYSGESDDSCNNCGYLRAVKYPVYIRHLAEELGTVEDALQIVDGKLEIHIPDLGVSGADGKLPVSERKGWTYNGWGIGTEDPNNTTAWVFYKECVTELTSDVEQALKTAVDNGYQIFMDATSCAIGTENSNFSVELAMSSYGLQYKLNVPTDAEDEYFLNFVNFDRAEAYSCSVAAKHNYSDYLNVTCVPESGYYGAYEVLDADGNVLAASKDFAGFSVYLNSGALSDDKPVVSVSKTQSGDLQYEISGINSNCNYQLESPNGDHADVYFLGGADADHKLYLTTDIQNSLNQTCVLYGVSLVELSGKIIVEVTEPLNIQVPAYDPSAALNTLIDEANSLGLLDYVDSSAFTAGGRVTRLDVAMLVADMMGLKVPAGATVNWPFTDGTDLTDQQKILITMLMEEDVLAGYADGSVRPGDELTNGGVVRILDNALGNPLVPITKGNNLPRDYWCYYNFATLDNLGILDDVDISVNDAAVIEDVLTMIIAAAEWNDGSYTAPVCAVSNVHMSGNNGPLSVRWDAPAAVTGIDGYTYAVTFYTASGNKMTFRCGSDTRMPVFGLNEGVYTRVVVNAYANGERFAGSVETSALKLTVTESNDSAANVKVYPTSSGAYTMVITGLKPHSDWHMFIGEKAGNYGSGYGSGSDSNGKAVVMLDDYAAELIQNGTFWYCLREFDSMGLSNNNTELTMEAVNRGGWQQITAANIDTTTTYGVSDIAFEGNRIEWTPSATAPAGMYYRVYLRVAGTDSDWVDHTGTESNAVPTYTAPAGEYDAILVNSCYDGWEVAQNFIEVKFKVVEDTAAAAPSSVCFNKLADGSGYEVVVAGLDQSKEHNMWLVDQQPDFYNRCGSKAKFDANGNAVFTFDYEQAVRLIGTGCYYRIVTCNSSTTGTGGLSNESHYVFNGAWEFYQDASAVSYEVTNIRFEDQYLKWNKPTAVPDDRDADYFIYLSSDDGNSWKEVCNTNSLSAACYPFPVGTYNKVRVATRYEGTWKAEVEMPISLTINAGADKDATGVNVSFTPVVENGETVAYKMTATGLTANTEYVFSLRSSNNGERREVVTDASGAAIVTIWNPDVVKTGYYQIIEHTGSTSGTNANNVPICTTAFANVGPTTKCLPASETIWFEEEGGFLRMYFDYEELNDLSAYDGYAVELSADGGSTWVNVDGLGFGETVSNITGCRLNPGTYNKVRIVIVPKDEMTTNAQVWFTKDIDLKVNSAATTAAVTFTPTGNSEEYKVDITGLTVGTNSNNSYEITLCDTDSIYGDWWCYSRCTEETTVSRTWQNWRFASGYYRLREYGDYVITNGTTAALTIYESQWARCIPPINDYPVTNLTYQNGLLSWQHPNVSGVEYRAYLYSTTENAWRNVSGTKGTEIPLYIARDDTYSKVRVETRQNGSVVGTVEMDVNIQIQFTYDQAAPTATFTETGTNQYTVSLSGLAANKEYALHLVNDPNNQTDRSLASGTADGNGNKEFGMGGSRTAELVKDGYYRVLELNDATTDANGVSVLTVAWCGDWALCSSAGSGNGGSGSGGSTNDYAVSNIQFGSITIRWDAPANISEVTGEVRYRVLLHDPATDEWVSHTKSSGTDVPTYTAPIGTYNKIRVLTMEDNNEIGCADADLSLTVSKTTQTLAAPTAVRFAPHETDTEAFTVTVTGLTAGNFYTLQLSDQADGSGNSRYSSCEAADSNGTVVFDMGGTKSVEMATSGYYRIIEQVSSTKTTTSCVVEIGYRNDWTAATLPDTAPATPVFGTPTIKTDGTFIWLELTAKNVDEPGQLEVWQENRNANGVATTSYRRFTSVGNTMYAWEGNVLKVYAAGSVSAAGALRVHLALKDADSGVMSAYSTNALVAGTDTAEAVVVKATKSAATETDAYNYLTVTKADGSNFEAGHYQMMRPSTLDYTTAIYMSEAKAELNAKSKQTEILASRSAKVMKVKPVQNSDNNIVLNTASYNEYVFTDVVMAEVVSAKTGTAVFDAERGVAESVTLTVPNGVMLQTTAPTVTPSLHNTTVSDVVVNGNTIAFKVTFTNLYGSKSTFFYLKDTDADLGYPLCTNALSVTLPNSN